MSCEHLLSRLGYECREIDARTIAVETPFTFADGEPIAFYIEDSGSAVLVHDNADTLAHLQGIGFDLSNRQRWRGIRNALTPYGLELQNDGLIVAQGDKASESDVVSNFVSAILAVLDFERDYLGLTEEQEEFLEEVEFYLKASKPGAELVHLPSVLGHSGRPHTFHFRFDGELIEATHPHGRTTGSILRKAMDVINTGRGETIRVVMDDRDDPERAKTETDILTTTVSVLAMTTLIERAGGTSRH